MTKSDDTSNVEQSLENPSVKHEDKNDDAPCSSKTDNKGKKSKPKESNVRQSFDKNPKKASVPDVQKSSKLRKSISSETQPLLGGEHSRSRDYGTERPARKRTIKSFLQEEKNRPVHLVSESNGALQGSHRISKTEQRLKEEKRKNEMFPDEKINEILRILGDDSTVEASSKTKKKSKENKHNAPKKNKKKLTKQKKVDKTKDLKVSGETAKPNSSLASVHVNAVQEDFLSLVPCSAVNEMTSEDDVNEFVTQKKRKGVHKQPTSGHVSPKNIAATNKRRFSDPSPTISKNPGQAFFQGRRSPCDQDRNVKDHNNVSLRSDPPFDRDCQSHWPTLPLLSGATNCKSVSGGNAASYASKLKSNLDSTGCSLASSSEDGSSTSSASSNNCNASTGFINSATERHVSALSNMPLFIEAATHIMKNLTPMNDCKETQYDHPLPPIKPFLTEVEPIRILERVVHGTNQTESFDFAKTGANAENAAESKANPTDSLAATSDDQHEAIKTSCDTPRPTVPDEPALPRDVEIDANRSQDRLLSEYEITNDVIFEFTSDCDDTNFTNIQILSELENKWGLGFFTQDFSENNLETAQSPDVPVKLLESRKMKVSFGDNKVLSDVDSKHTAPNWDDVNVSKPSTDNVVFLLPSMRISSNMNEWNDPGHFQLRSAVNVLLQEWNTAVSEGKYYQE